MLCNTYKLRGKVLMLIRGNYEFLKHLILQFFSSINIWHYFSFSGSVRALEVVIVTIHLLLVTVYRAKCETSTQRWDCHLTQHTPTGCLFKLLDCSYWCHKVRYVALNCDEVLFNVAKGCAIPQSVLFLNPKPSNNLWCWIRTWFHRHRVESITVWHSLTALCSTAWQVAGSCWLFLGKIIHKESAAPKISLWLFCPSRFLLSPALCLEEADLPTDTRDLLAELCWNANKRWRIFLSKVKVVPYHHSHLVSKVQLWF